MTRPPWMSPPLEKMSMVKLRVFEPFEKKEMVFEGVLMSELMKIIGADSSATEVHLTALDDYKIDLPMSALKKADVLLATKADGNHMSIVDGGPTRIIFPPDRTWPATPTCGSGTSTRWSSAERRC